MDGYTCSDPDRAALLASGVADDGTAGVVLRTRRAVRAFRPAGRELE